MSASERRMTKNAIDYKDFVDFTVKLRRAMLAGHVTRTNREPSASRRRNQTAYGAWRQGQAETLRQGNAGVDRHPRNGWGADRSRADRPPALGGEQGRTGARGARGLVQDLSHAGEVQGAVGVGHAARVRRRRLAGAARIAATFGQMSSALTFPPDHSSILIASMGDGLTFGSFTSRQA